MLINTKSNIIELDLLVGADYYWSLVNPYKLPVERDDMWLNPDRFGRYFLFGKIPGLAKVQSQSVNHVCIHHINVEQPNLRDYVRTKCQILDNSELIHESNVFEVVRELNSYDALGFQVSSHEKDDNEALETFKSNMYKDEETN